ncbi:hypothetical protein LEP1GSC072_1211 [Leptospira noguchii str. Bonito]|nr:hypothetical protein LEP1GSC072_1211 [Leptospira noguchii str. Bonito]
MESFESSERKALRGKLPFLLRKYSKQIASMNVFITGRVKSNTIGRW